MPGKLFIWGNNGSGQLGQGTTSPIEYATLQKIGNDTDWDTIAYGFGFAVAIKNGALYGWGDNQYHQLSDAYRQTVIDTPQQIGTFTDWEDVGASQRCVIALRGGKLYCLGSNAFGTTGLNTTTGNTTTPTQIGTDTNWSKIAVGTLHVLAIKTTGTLWAWGSNTNSRLGDGTTTTRTVPTQIGTATDWTEVSAGDTHSLGLRTGVLYSWGSNGSGKTGLNTTTGNTTTPTQVGTNTDWSKISAGQDHSGAIRGGQLFTWGSASSGGLGNGLTTPDALVPTQIGTDTNWEDIRCCRSNTFALKNGAKLYSWGNNFSGRTGLGTTSGNTLTITQIGTASGWTLGKIVAGNSDRDTSAGILNGELYTWGSARRNQIGTTGAKTIFSEPIQVGSNEDWDTIAVRGGGSSSIPYAVGIRGGKLYSWGSNASGKTGLNTTSGNTTTPTQIGTATDWAKVSIGNEHVLAIKTNGTLWSWGANTNGKTGLGTTSGNTSTPQQVGTATDWTEISAGASFSLGIKGGKLYSWGAATNGQLGNNTTTPDVSSPTEINSDTDWTDVKAGLTSALALKTGKLYSWGSNNNGQTGLNTGTGNTLVPTQVGTGTDWAIIAKTTSHSLAIKTNGTLWSFGTESNGQLGLNRTSPNALTPEQVGTATDWSKISAGSLFSLAVKNNDLYGFGIAGNGNYPSTLYQNLVPTLSDNTKDWQQIAGSESNDAYMTIAGIATTGSPPVNTVLPSVSGTKRVGETLTTTNGTWTGTPTPTYTYKWQVSNDGSTGWTDISGATSSTFTITSSEAGKYLRFSVTATNSEGAVIATSAATVQVATGVPTEGLIRHSSKTNAAIPTEGLIFWPRLDND